MTAYRPDRRALIAGIGASVFLPVMARADVVTTQIDLPVSKGRVSKVTVWSPLAPKGVVLFSTGGNSWPEQYDKLAQFLVGLGFVVLAPLHTDSLHIPEDKRASLQTGFGDRLADMLALSGYARARYAGLPVVAMGHSYGSLFALILGGGLSYLGPVANPDVKAVVCFSSPGAIPGLINPSSYATLKTPLLMVTGDKDTVPGFVADWHDHELPFVGTPVKGSYELVIKDGGHELIGGANAVQYDLATSLTATFLSDSVLGASKPMVLPDGALAELKSK